MADRTIYTFQVGGSSRVNETHFLNLACGLCGVNVQAPVIASTGFEYGPNGGKWALCTNCSGPICVDDRGRQFPHPLVGDPVGGLPDEIETAYDEARACLGVGAFSACEMVARKILMHVAVERTGAKERKAFSEYVDDLESAGLTTSSMKPWIDFIRDRGGRATHRLPATTADQARQTMHFLTMLLRICYEMEHLAGMDGLA